MQITSESVKTGHPDMVADSIAASIIAEILEEEGKIGLTIDNMPHCGIEVFLGKDICVVGGEVSTRVNVDIEKCVRQTILSIGYNDCALGLDGNSLEIINKIIPQSCDINIGTRADLGKYKEIGAGDQGIIYGFACNETPELLPIPFVLVNSMMRGFENCRKPMFAPDGKGQVTVEYDGQGVAGRVAKVLMSNAIDYRHVKENSKEMLEQEARRIAMESLHSWVDDETEFFFNPTGEWQAVNSCSAADSGITGRKLVVQFYGGYPGAAPLVREPRRWARYVADSLIETSIARDVLLLTRVDKPALLRQLFELACRYSGQILSYTKMLGQLQDAGNTTTLAHYLHLLAAAGMVCGVQKFAGDAARSRGSSPKLQVLNTALMSATAGLSFREAKADRESWGRLVESAVGAHLANAAAAGECELFYWRERNREVDFVVRAGRRVIAIEVKSGRAPQAHRGTVAFVEAFEPDRTLLVGGDGIALDEFLERPVAHWIGA